jgi:hypothetical protein
MSRYAHHLAGRSFGRLGTVVDTPPLMTITGFAENRHGNKHGLDRAVNRSVTSADRLSAVKDPLVVLDQGQGRNYAFLNERALVVLNASSGELITTYGADDYDDGIKRILHAAGY